MSKELLLKANGEAMLVSEDYDLSLELASGRIVLLEQKVKN